MADDPQLPYLIAAADNGVLNALDLMVDEAGADLLIARLQYLKKDRNHVHVDTDPVSLYGHAKVYPEIIITWVERD